MMAKLDMWDHGQTWTLACTHLVHLSTTGPTGSERGAQNPLFLTLPLGTEGGHRRRGHWPAYPSLCSPGTVAPRARLRSPPTVGYPHGPAEAPLVADAVA